MDKRGSLSPLLRPIRRGARPITKCEMGPPSTRSLPSPVKGQLVQPLMFFEDLERVACCATVSSPTQLGIRCTTLAKKLTGSYQVTEL